MAMFGGHNGASMMVNWTMVEVVVERERERERERGEKKIVRRAYIRPLLTGNPSVN